MAVVDDFLKDEVRNGFYVPTAIKQAWNANIMVLQEIDRICKKYDIMYYADWGSVLGAVRHGGFIPWDDDLDICMKRDDYIRFREVADTELPKEFAIHDFERKENHWLFLSRVVNTNHINFNSSHLEKYHNFPYIAVVDIFILDYLYRDNAEEKKRCEEIMNILAVADGIVENKLKENVIEYKLAEFEKKYSIKLNRKATSREIGVDLYKLAEQQMMRAPKEDAEQVGYIFPWILKGGKGTSVKYFEKTVQLPFGNFSIPVSAYYHRFLKERYGDYLTVHKIWDGHQYPFFEGQRANLQKAASYELLEYRYEKDKIVPKMDTENLKKLAKECSEQLVSMVGEIDKLVEANQVDAAVDKLIEAQQLAVDFATLVEHVKGEKKASCRRVVEYLQVYCDKLFAVYNDIQEQRKELSQNMQYFYHAAAEVSEQIRQWIIERKEVVFISVGADLWNGFDRLYRELILMDDADIYIIPVPLLSKDALGNVRMSKEEIRSSICLESYQEDLELTSWKDFDLTLHYPDTIYIQNPYDGENPCMTVPAYYYAENLRKYTKELVYIPPYEVEKFDEEDYCDVHNMKYNVTAPGIVYADRVMVQSDHMRDMYIARLTEFAGEHTRSMWEEKIQSGKLPVSWCKEMITDEKLRELMSDDAHKTVFYCIGINELSECSDTVVEKVREKLQILRNAADKIRVCVGIYPPSLEEWKRIDAGKTDQIVTDICDYCETYSWVLTCLEQDKWKQIAEVCDAYYGSVSPLVLLFQECGKMIMICDYSA